MKCHNINFSRCNPSILVNFQGMPASDDGEHPWPGSVHFGLDTGVVQIGWHMPIDDAVALRKQLDSAIVSAGKGQRR